MWRSTIISRSALDFWVKSIPFFIIAIPKLNMYSSFFSSILGRTFYFCFWSLDLFDNSLLLSLRKNACQRILTEGKFNLAQQSGNAVCQDGEVMAISRYKVWGSGVCSSGIIFCLVVESSEETVGQGYDAHSCPTGWILCSGIHFPPKFPNLHKQDQEATT